MGPDQIGTALQVTEVLGHLGYLLLAGTLLFWVLVWPDGVLERTLVGLAVTGVVILTLTTVAPVLLPVLWGGQAWQEVVTPVAGAALMVRLAALAATAFFLPDLLDAPVRGGRAVLCGTVVLALTGALVVSSLSAPAGTATTVSGIPLLTLGVHLLAAAAWLGGLVALGALVLRGRRAVLPHLLPRMSVVAVLSVTVLLLSGTAAVFAPGDGRAPLSGRDLALVGAKTAVFALMLGLDRVVRRSADAALSDPVDEHHRPLVLARLDPDQWGPLASVDPPPPPAAPPRGARRSLVAVLGAELVLAVVALGLTALLAV